jgi:hypothetical protein
LTEITIPFLQQQTVVFFTVEIFHRKEKEQQTASEKAELDRRERRLQFPHAEHSLGSKRGREQAKAAEKGVRHSLNAI